MSVVFDEIVTEVNAPSTSTAEDGSPSSPEGASEAAPAQPDLYQTFERLKNRQLRLFAD